MARRRRRNGNVRNSASPENPAVPLDPDYWDDLGWLGARTDSGVRMSHAQAIGHPPIIRAINLIARGVAKLPSRVHKIAANGDDTQIDASHPADRLLRIKANKSMRSYTWKTSMMYHALFRGNGYSGIVRQGSDPIAMILLDPTKTSTFWVGDELWYATQVRNEKRKLPAADVFHLKGLSFDGIVGHDVLQILANAMGMGPAARKWMSKLLSRGSTAGGLLQLPRELSPDARKKRQEEFEKYQAGLDNAFKTLALEDGSKWIRTMITPQEAAIFEVLQFDVRLVANIFGLPPHKLGDNSKAAYNSLEQENKSYLEDCLDPWICEFETEATDKLLAEDEVSKATHEVRLDRTQLQLGDMKSQADSFGKLVNDGLMLADEGRSRMGMPPLPNGQGKKLRIPVQVAIDGHIAGVQPETSPALSPAAPPSNDPPITNFRDYALAQLSGLENAAQELLTDRLRRLAAIDADQRTKLANKAEALADHGRKHQERVRDALAPMLPVLAIANGRPSTARTAEMIAQEINGLGLDDQVRKTIALCSQD